MGNQTKLMLLHPKLQPNILHAMFTCALGSGRCRCLVMLNHRIKTAMMCNMFMKPHAFYFLIKNVGALRFLTQLQFLQRCLQAKCSIHAESSQTHTKIVSYWNSG